MPATIDKNAVISGDEEQLNILLSAHFIDYGKTDAQRLNATEKQHLGVIAYKSLQAYTSWDTNHSSKMIAGLEKNSKLSLPSDTRAQVSFNLHLVNELSRCEQLDPKLCASLLRLILPLFSYSVADISIWRRGHAIRRLIDTLYTASLGWQEDFARHSEAHQQLLNEIIDAALAVTPGDANGLEQVVGDAASRLEKSGQRFQTLAKRLCDSESGALKARQANDTVVRFFNRVSKGKMLPASVSRFIRDSLVPELKLLIIALGPQNAQWLRIRKLVETVISLYQPGAADIQDARRKSMLMNIGDELSAALNGLALDADIKDTVINQIGFDLAKIASGVADHEMQAIEPIPQDDATAGIDTTVTKSLLEQAGRYEVGQWFLYNDGDKQIRMRLSLHLQDFGQLMFTNFVGQKVMSQSLADFAYLLSSGKVVPLFQGSVTERAYQSLIARLLDGFDAIYEKHLAIETRMREEALAREKEAQRLAQLEAERAEAERLERERQEKIAAEKARAEAEARERALAAEKARAEAEALRIQQEEEAKARELEKLTADLRKQARLTLDSLSLGSWIELRTEAGEDLLRVKLAVKFNATKRYVFVDHDGVTVGEFHRDDLVDLVMAGDARLLESDEKFAQRLVKVVETIKAGR